jgi:hypothetical protein
MAEPRRAVSCGVCGAPLGRSQTIWCSRRCREKGKARAFRAEVRRVPPAGSGFARPCSLDAYYAAYTATCDRHRGGAAHGAVAGAARPGSAARAGGALRAGATIVMGQTGTGKVPEGGRRGTSPSPIRHLPRPCISRAREEVNPLPSPRPFTRRHPHIQCPRVARTTGGVAPRRYPWHSQIVTSPA